MARRVNQNWRRLACGLLLALVKRAGPKTASRLIDDLPADLRPSIAEFYRTWRLAHVRARREGADLT